MKRRVRIYKAGGQQGEYINKTAQFLMKAQLGAERSSEEKMMDSISQALAQGMSPEDILAQLVEMGIDQEVAVAAIQQIVESMQPQEEEQPEAQEGQEVGNPILEQYDRVAATQQPQEEEEPTDEEEQSYYTPYTEFPGIEQYVPEYTPFAGELETYDVNNPFADMLYSKEGGPVAKKDFVKNVMNLVKKQNGGDTEKNTADNTDIPVNGREEKFNNFLGAIKGTAQNAILKKAIGNMYNDMMQEGGITDQASGKTMFQGGGEDGEDETSKVNLAFTDSKNVTDPYFKYGGLPKAQYGPQNWNEVDDNKNGIPDYLELNYLNQTVKKDESKDKSNDKSKTQSDPSNGRHPLSFIDPIRAQGNRYLNPFGKIFNYDYSYYKPVGANKNMAAIQYDPELMGKPTNVELRRSGRLKEMDMIFDKSNKSNINSITDMKFRRSGVPKSFTINYGAPTATGANPAFDFMLSKYAANKEKQAETPKSNGAPTGPGVAPWADDDQRSRFFRGKEENSKSAKRAMELINEEVLADKKAYGGPMYEYGGYYAYGGDLPEYQSQTSDTKGSSVTTNPQIIPQIERMSSPDWLSTSVNSLQPKKLSEVADEQRDAEGLVNVGNTPQAELEQKQNSIKFKTKNKYNIDPKAALDNFNAAANIGLGFIEDLQSRKANQDQWYNYNADNLYATNNKRDRGTYEVNSGLFRPDEMGFTGVVEYGGTVYAEGGEAYMTQEEIDDFIANGGELEYLND